MLKIKSYFKRCKGNECLKLCWNGCGEKESLLHMWWYCPDVKLFWNQIVKAASIMLSINLIVCPAICLLSNRAADFHT
uniref:Reverse transcriptase zinc-binding domain-containing protein n=1 Tax=Poecilia mexicana TaxID=48701 RepID=A0A3B3WWG4_9TELE